MSFVLIKASDYNVAEDDETIWIYNKKNALCVRFKNGKSDCRSGVERFGRSLRNY